MRCLWSNDSLYFRFTCPYTKLTTFEPVSPTERLGLWDRDVVEVFLAPDPQNVRRYGEYEVAPTNERLDVLISPEDKDFAWDSRFASAVKVDESAKVWTAELRIPLLDPRRRAPVNRRDVAPQPVPLRPRRQGLPRLEPDADRDGTHPRAIRDSEFEE